MPDLNIDSIKSRTFDALVIGSGMSGGWAAKELTEKGLKTLVIERGKEVLHSRDYVTTNKYPWEFDHRNELTVKIKQENPVLSRCYAFREDTLQLFVKDNEHPYIQEKPFDWIRGYQTGGRSLLWARQTQRWSDLDFQGPARDGFAVEWPIGYHDLAPWYSHVEKFAGISGNKDGLPELPDGEFLPPMEMTCVEDYFSKFVAKNYKNQRHVIIGRCAHITGNMDQFTNQGRVICQYRNLCQRGCPFGAYFSSNSSTLPWATRTGNLTMIHDSIVHSILYDEQKQRASGVLVMDAKTKETTEYFANLIFLNAGALNTNLILLNSKSNRFPEGLGNDNGLLGKFVAFHSYRGRISGEYEGFQDRANTGRRPNGCYIPRFRNLYKQETDFLRGYAAGFSANRRINMNTEGLVGEDLKKNLLNPSYGIWNVGSHFMGETIPKKENLVRLDPEKKDEWGMPLLITSIGYDENDEKMLKDFFEQFTEMFTDAGFKNIKTHDSHQAPGLDIHEMGGVRMGKDPETSLLNKWNQLHACKNVYVTDGACMTSTGTQNPSLTYMAMTARAANHAVKQTV
jgi:choline dehydrogenase-like flavoprotein